MSLNWIDPLTCSIWYIGVCLGAGLILIDTSATRSPAEVYKDAFRPGMVIAVEPIIEIPDRRLYVRIEDTVLIAEKGPVILSAAVPKEVGDVLGLMKAAGGM